MKIIFLTHYYHPHIGGVETHSSNVAKELIKKGHSVTVLTENHTGALKKWEMIDGVKVIRFRYPHVKWLGLLTVWFNLWKLRKVIENSDIVHVHDVFVWYKPFVFLFKDKPVFTTFHGWEGIWPIPQKNIKLKKLAEKYSKGTIAVGRYIGKYYGIKATKVIYGSTNYQKDSVTKNKIKDSVLYVGRLQKDTGLPLFLKSLDENKFKVVKFVGDGEMWKECDKYGTVLGFRDATPFIAEAEYLVPGGYLTYIQGISQGCKILVYPDNPLKVDYWKEIRSVKSFPTWGQIANEYLDLYNRT